jgi:GNAT superfamily N-acetyltransferase
MDDALVIRPARPDDRAGMERICAHTWDWGDYIPEVWDAWLADEDKLMLVAELEGRMVALGQVAFQPGGQAWFEAMRVDPDYRRQGIARLFIERKMEEARKRGARVARLGTGGNNTPVHRLMARIGMEQVGAYVLWVAAAEGMAGAEPPDILGPGQRAALGAFLQGSRVLAHTGGLYSTGWAWAELLDEDLDRFLAAGQVLARRAAGGAIEALAIVDHQAGDDRLWIGFADAAPGQEEALAGLAKTIRAYAGQVGAERAAVMLPPVDWLRETFGRAGYGLGDWEGELWIFEKPLVGRGVTAPPPGGGGFRRESQGEADDG